jgi:phospholipid/cholesterol/gamma-HCH transport system ATP-binding protein
MSTTSPFIEVRDLTVGWNDQPPLLVGTSFDVRRGEIFAVLGVSGSGKTTLMRCLIGLERPRAGIVTGEGAPSLDAARPNFGVMFQHGALFGSMTVGENVALPLERWTDLPHEAVRAIVRAKLGLVGLRAAENKLPSDLSGGMIKRAAIARAMALEPAVLFLDEPSSGLDPITSAGLDQLIATLRAVLDITVILVTHELGSIFAIADRCVLLDPGERNIIAEGSPHALRTSPDLRVRAFFNRSTKEA